ncbi:PLC-like phosphodiesterases superfamily protein [Actinidia rufa]|uniref:PLC-like phosphodiesterases superfamily protein n=1 Tax=Actinidia rufa TaxID=165716 RepID=A0A7J0ELG2_9ERIC|nr:PLC-like phosphodiesterases superfamily protein [Actinidia rufa]
MFTLLNLNVMLNVTRTLFNKLIKNNGKGGLQGIVSEVKGIFRNPGAIPKIKEAKLSLLTYGKLNNVPEAVYMQHLMGVEGVIVDLVQEITEAVSYMIKPSMEEGEEEVLVEGEGQIQVKAKPQFSERELSFLLKLIPELMQL